MNVLGLDLGKRTGFAIGEPGKPPFRSGTVILGKPGDPPGVIYATLQRWIARERGTYPIVMLAHATTLPLEAMRNRRNAEATVKMAYGLLAAVQTACHDCGIRRQEVAEATARKHFVGKGRQGSREETKIATISRCIQLRLVPSDCTDEDRCDALAIQDWACATHFSKSVSTLKLHLFR